jgi:hypothetical protein
VAFHLLLYVQLSLVLPVGWASVEGCLQAFLDIPFAHLETVGWLVCIASANCSSTQPGPSGLWSVLSRMRA